MQLMSPKAEDTILDVGVNDTTWRSSNFLEASYPWPSHITAIGPKPMPAFSAAFPDVRFVEADGRSLPFVDGSFDIGFSNAVVEHVGGRDEQRRLIAEMVRTCHRSFICTPNRWFPVDPHTLLPFAHWLPRRAWHAVLRLTGNGRWASVDALNPLSGAELLSFFPAGISVRLERQRMLGMTSVLIAIAESASSEAGKPLDQDAR
jgi:hypothetical protein